MTAAAVAGRARSACLGLVATLCVLFTAWHVVRYSAATAALVSALGVLPWLALSPGLAAGRPRPYALAMLLTAPYLAYGLMEVLANPGARAYAGALVLVAFALFVALLAFLRLSRRRAAAPP